MNCPAIDSIIEEADEVGGEIEDKRVLDVALSLRADGGAVCDDCYGR